MAYTNQNETPYVISYSALRKAVGVLGIALPVVLIIGAGVSVKYHAIQRSISMYYHTNMRDFLVGLLCAVALFLFAYRGYNIWDRIAGLAACIFALGVAFFPASADHTFTTIHMIHLIAACSFFLVLSAISLFLFTKTKKDEIPTKQKLKRNFIYRLCGILIFASILLIALYLLFLENAWLSLNKLNPAFWLEALALWAFGISWLVKGETIFTDK